MASTAMRRRIYDAARREDLTFEHVYNKPTYFRWWLSENEYRRLTKAEREAVEELLHEGVLREWHNPCRFGRGLLDGTSKPFTPEPAAASEGSEGKQR